MNAKEITTGEKRITCVRTGGKIEKLKQWMDKNINKSENIHRQR